MRVADPPARSDGRGRTVAVIRKPSDAMFPLYPPIACMVRNGLTNFAVFMSFFPHLFSKIRHQQKRMQVYTGRSESFMRAFLAIDNRDDAHDCAARLADRFCRLDRRAARGCHVFDDDDAFARHRLVARQAFDQAFGAVFFGLLAHEKRRQLAPARVGHGRDGRRNGHRAHFKPADEIGFYTFELVEDEGGNQMRALAIEHGGFHVEVMGRGLARGELHFGAD